MDAHLFRLFCDSLLPALQGSRLEKIHQPGQGVTVFTLHSFTLKKRALVLKAEHGSPFLFLSEHRMPVNAPPPAPVMRLRKYLSGRHVAQAFAHWEQRRLYLQFGGSPADPSVTTNALWLELDLREGPRLLFTPPPAPEATLWPDAHELPGLLFPPADAPGAEPWRDWPVLSPALRRTLALMDEPDAAGLLLDLQAGGGDLFLYEDARNRLEAFAWPLPPSLRKNRKESVTPRILESLARVGDQLVYSPMAQKAGQMAAKPYEQEQRRLGKLLAKLDAEEERMAGLIARKDDALLLQAQLYRFAPELKLAEVSLDAPSGPLTLRLDPLLTVRENMAAMFHQAGRGQRGLTHLAARREAVRASLEAARQAALASKASAGSAMAHKAAAQAGAGAGGASAAPRGANRALPALPALPKEVEAARSTNGFLLLRGRNARGNALLLKLAAPHDYWFHTANGPSAHVVLRRDSPGQNVPSEDLADAGRMVAKKSWLAQEERAEIQFALVKHIRGMKNAAVGMVRIEQSLGTFLVKVEGKGLSED